MFKNLMIATTVGSALVLAACSGPKDTVIPSDPKQWDTIADSVKELSDEDKALFTAYVVRMTMASALAGGKGGIPPGTTIADAIRLQKEFHEKRKQEEAEADLLKAKLAAERAAEVEKLKQVATVTLVDLKVLPKNYDYDRYSDRLDLVIGVQNRSGKNISGIKGDLVFADQFGTEITTMGLSLDEDIPANTTKSITGYGKDINQFRDEDTKLAVTPLSKMRVTFVPEMIVFSDGSSVGKPSSAEP
jgi:hypothetical protein